ncbi:MAG TPA: chromate efflux transporter [Thermomicrobiales bacterium]|nr:chromate efflux transporter [Thermomicrobiales bacterium]
MADVFRVFLRLGLTSFGGPIAHLGFFRHEFVERREWVSPDDYAAIVSICQTLPGPTSSQVGLMIGRRMAGLPGALAAWSGFTMPSVVALTIAALGLARFDAAVIDRALDGLMVVAVAVVALAVRDMGRTAWTDRNRATLGILAATILLIWSSPVVQVVVITLGLVVGLAAWRWGRPEGTGTPAPANRIRGRVPRSAIACLTAFGALLVLLPPLAAATGWRPLELVAGFYRSGSLVFGGGHVVLPLLEQLVVPSGWVSPDDVAVGYGLAQAVPGPLFTYASYLGAATGGPGLAGIGLALLATGAIFLPSFLLVFGVAPFQDRLRSRAALAGLAGVNAVVVGVLLAALYDPIWRSAIHEPGDVALLLVAVAALHWWRLPAWVVVLGGAAAGAIFG